MTQFTDIGMQENGTGGDIVIKGNDLWVVRGFQNMVYLAMFGGNVDQSTPRDATPGAERLDWWGNMLMSEAPNQQFNSLSERALRDTALNSEGRRRIENAVKQDVKFISEFAEVEVDVAITGWDRVQIDVRVLEPGTQQEALFRFIWDGTGTKESNLEAIAYVKDYDTSDYKLVDYK